MYEKDQLLDEVEIEHRLPPVSLQIKAIQVWCIKLFGLLFLLNILVFIYFSYIHDLIELNLFSIWFLPSFSFVVITRIQKLAKLRPAFLYYLEGTENVRWTQLILKEVLNFFIYILYFFFFLLGCLVVFLFLVYYAESALVFYKGRTLLFQSLFILFQLMILCRALYQEKKGIIETHDTISRL